MHQKPVETPKMSSENMVLTGYYATWMSITIIFGCRMAAAGIHGSGIGRKIMPWGF